MRRVRGPSADDIQNILYTIPSKEALAERLRECYDESRSEAVDLTDTDYAGCVYVIECGNASEEEARRLSLFKHEKKEVPWWVAPARNSDTRLYVGRTKNLCRRIWEHICGADNNGAHFTDVFFPKQLRRVFLYDRYDQRDAIEARVAQTVDRENNAFVYSDCYDSISGYKEYRDDS